MGDMDENKSAYDTRKFDRWKYAEMKRKNDRDTSSTNEDSSKENPTGRDSIGIKGE